MYTDIGKRLEEMRGIQEQLGQFFDEARERFRYTLEDGGVRFSREVQLLQRRYRVSSLRYLLDAGLTLYQHICFRAYGVPRVRRRDYLVNDRHTPGYLNTIEKLNCTYCRYANSMVAYTREIVARTEQYWCPIRHARRVSYAHPRYPGFFAYGDAASCQQGLAGKRRALESEVPGRGQGRADV